MKRKIVFENGREFIGEAFGSTNDVVSEVVFNTGMVGYQEILSDPAYKDLSIVMTYPLIGNYGIIEEDFDSKIIGVKALITKEYNDKPSNFRYANTLAETLEDYGVAGITHVDTRAITRMIAQSGTMKACICNEEKSTKEALSMIKKDKENNKLIEDISCKKKWYSRCSNPEYNVVAIDTGITNHNLYDLKESRINVTIVPFNTDIDKIIDLNPDGIFLPNSPGDPNKHKEINKVIKKLIGKVPIFGVGNGCNEIALAEGLKVEKMKTGHHGSNHSIKEEETGKLIVVGQNHHYTIKEFKKKGINITHKNVLDNTIEGIDISKKMCFGVEYYASGITNPEDNKKQMQKFINYMNEYRGEANA